MLDRSIVEFRACENDPCAVIRRKRLSLAYAIRIRQLRRIDKSYRFLSVKIRITSGDRRI
jgi:hypothetical protein